MRSRLKRVAVTATIAVTTASTFALLGTPAAAAAPIVCEANSSWLKTSGSRSYVLTHVRGYHSPPGASIKLTKSASWERTLTSGITQSGEVSVSASGVIAKAEATYRVNLASSGSKTSTSSQSVVFTLGSSSKDRYYAVYAGRRYWKGSWDKYRCNGYGTAYNLVAWGSWRSFQSHLEGAALCPASRYATGTLPYKACKLTWS